MKRAITTRASVRPNRQRRIGASIALDRFFLFGEVKNLADWVGKSPPTGAMVVLLLDFPSGKSSAYICSTAPDAMPTLLVSYHTNPRLTSRPINGRLFRIFSMLNIHILLSLSCQTRKGFCTPCRRGRHLTLSLRPVVYRLIWATSPMILCRHLCQPWSTQILADELQGTKT